MHIIFKLNIEGQMKLKKKVSNTHLSSLITLALPERNGPLSTEIKQLMVGPGQVLSVSHYVS